MSWLSKKQPVVALSTSEAEYVALSLAAQEGSKVVCRSTGTNKLDCPSRKIIKERLHWLEIRLLIPGPSTFNFDIRFHFIWKAQEESIVDIVYCHTSEMVADLLTKPIPCNQFEKLRTLMGMKNLLTNSTN